MRSAQKLRVRRFQKFYEGFGTDCLERLVSQLTCRLEFLCTQYYRWWTEEAWLVHAELSMIYIYNMMREDGRHEREVIVVASCTKLTYVVIA